ncbi:hypothetical protein [uncultured Shewanella sp.]|uniref:hypothetical protein n=1 Tax=uncultured Shewanella sp. TaxID=173975 RepID=UPI002631ECC9|nr:hypothetical protein [uncultured Shewanella sp.]
MYSVLPNKALNPHGTLSDIFIGMSFESFHQICEWVWHLPYGRPNDSQHYMSVVNEKKGTCSTKHALLKALADELRIDVALTVGIYAMTEANTPGVGHVLKQYRQDFIPEAHCYLTYQNHRVDLTRLMKAESEPITAFFIEKNILPDEIQTAKPPFHYQFIQNRFGCDKAPLIWAIREQCIQALSV